MKISATVVATMSSRINDLESLLSAANLRIEDLEDEIATRDYISREWIMYFLDKLDARVPSRLVKASHKAQADLAGGGIGN